MRLNDVEGRRGAVGVLRQSHSQDNQWSRALRKDAKRYGIWNMKRIKEVDAAQLRMF